MVLVCIYVAKNNDLDQKSPLLVMDSYFIFSYLNTFSGLKNIYCLNIRVTSTRFF